MAPTKATNGEVLAQLNFPLYTIHMLTNRHVIVGGGGGSANTGISNGFGIFELSHDGKRFTSEEVTRHETGPIVVMNSSSFSDKKHTFLVAGQESHCQLYNVESLLVEDISHSEPGLKQRKKKEQSAKRLKFAIKHSDSVQAAFGGPDPLVRVVRVHPTGRLLATGGTDGVVRVWRFPSLQKAFELEGHAREVDDIDFAPNSAWMATVAKDGEAILWDCGRGREVRRLRWRQPEGARYLYKRARFGAVEGEKACVLYMLANPTGVARKQKAYLQQWEPGAGVVKNRVAVDESLSALAVRNDGRFVAIGTMFTGSVMIYVAFSLQRVINVNRAHSMFVTGLEFIPVLDNHTVASGAEAAVLSISVDNNICIHTLSYRRTVPLIVGLLILLLALFLTFLFCSYIGL